VQQHIVILGAGESGIGAALLAKRQGYDVFVSDRGIIGASFLEELKQHEIPFESGSHDEARILKSDLVIKSPGIPEKAPLVKKIREAGIPLISEIEWAYRFAGNSTIVAITGSNGKTTTTALTHHLLRVAGIDAALVGNIGYSFARQVATEPKPVYVVEVSSFQLDDIVSFKPNIAILTNITEDHLDRYEYRLENYAHSKFRIAEQQSEQDVFIYNIDDPYTMKYLTNYPIKSTLAPISMRKELPQGAYLSQAQLFMKWKQEEVRMSIDDFALKGKHNQYNSMAASMAATAMDIRKEKIREALQTFESLEHRMEKVLTVKGIEFINDSKATNVNSTWFALESMNKPVILILGGVDKGNDYSLLKSLVEEKVKAIVCLGTDNQAIVDAFADVVPLILETNSAQQAVETSYQVANKGEVVLLSPACASFDLFDNYEDRGNQFKQAVRNL
jgi:UDP-N-acetylmuramoylalanine--D-glutamate ligase